MQDTWVQSLGREDPLEKEMATHCSILAWEISRTEEPGGLQSMGLQRVRHNVTTEHTGAILCCSFGYGTGLMFTTVSSSIKWKES